MQSNDLFGLWCFIIPAHQLIKSTLKGLMMKIVCIAASFIPSNTANSIQVIKAAHALAEIGNDVTLLVPGDAKVSWENLKSHYGLRKPFTIQWIHENLIFKRYDFAFSAVQTARKMKPDLIYTWVLQAAVLSLWQGIPTILELHDRVTGHIGPWLFMRFWRSKTKRRLLTNTKALKDRLILDFDLSNHQEQILVAPNGVELERYQELPSPEETRQILGLSPGFTAGYTGHFYAGRGMQLMFDLAEALPEINFLWVGGQPEDVLLWEKRAESSGLNNLYLTGFIENAKLPLFQAAADVLLMPYGERIAGSGGGNSAEIASPMKMFEYMAAGRAIISSDLPVIHEVLNQKTAVFCPPNALSEWKEALVNLRNDKFTREELGSRARTAVQKYTWQNRAEKALESLG
jgi:glycosyltransferase involved in cell wall biosynthesis